MPKSSYVFGESELKISFHSLDLVQFAIKGLLEKISRKRIKISPGLSRMNSGRAFLVLWLKTQSER